MAVIDNYVNSVSINPADGKPMPNFSIAGNNVKDYGPVTPNDTTVLSNCIGLLVTVAGTVTVTKPNNQDVTIPAEFLAPGIILPFPCKRIKASGTTASGIWAVYG